MELESVYNLLIKSTRKARVAIFEYWLKAIFAISAVKHCPKGEIKIKFPTTKPPIFAFFKKNIRLWGQNLLCKRAEELVRSTVYASS